MLTEVVTDRRQQILRSQYKMRYGLQDSVLGQKFKKEYYLMEATTRLL